MSLGFLVLVVGDGGGGGDVGGLLPSSSPGRLGAAPLRAGARDMAFERGWGGELSSGFQ